MVFIKSASYSLPNVSLPPPSGPRMVRLPEDSLPGARVAQFLLSRCLHTVSTRLGRKFATMKSVRGRVMVAA